MTESHGECFKPTKEQRYVNISDQLLASEDSVEPGGATRPLELQKGTRAHHGSRILS